MGLKKDLGLYRPIETIEHECLLSIIYTRTMLSKLAYKYFSKFSITETQFNVLMQLKYSEKEGVSQVILSKRLFVNKANMTGLIDRLEKMHLVERTVRSRDRRINMTKITKHGRDILSKVESNYFKRVKEIMNNLSKNQIYEMTAGLEKIRSNIKKSIKK